MRAVKVVKYQLNYKRLFYREKQRLSSFLKGIGCGIHHVGSTAVPGLGGKGFIDIQVTVKKKGLMKKAKRAVELAGYKYSDDGGAPERLFNRRITTKNTYHVHIVVAGSEAAMEHILFRDYLIANPAVAKQYMQLKRKLAKTVKTRKQYLRGKKQFIERVIRAARASA